MAGYWLKLYVEILDDPKYHRLSEPAKLGMIELMMVAKKCDRDGELPSLEDIAFYTRRDVDWWLPVIEELRDIAYLVEDGDHNTIRKFSERQGSVSSADRIKAWREKQQKEEYERNNPVTKVKRNVTEIKSQNREESEEEGENISQNPPTNQALMAVFDITGFTALPSRGREDAEYAIDSLWQRHPKREKLRDYLRPYWVEWTGRQYNKSNMGWLDWAVTGEIPPPRKNGREPPYKPTSPDIIAAGAEILRKAREAKGDEIGK